MKINLKIKNLFLQHQSEMFRIAFRLLNNKEEARDVVSEVFTKLMETDVVTENHTGYLYTAVRNSCLNLLRHKQTAERVHRLLPIGEELSESVQTENNKLLEEILHFVDTELTSQTHKVVQLRFRDGMTYRQIAETLDISEAAVYKHLAQAIRKLKERFNP